MFVQSGNYFLSVVLFYPLNWVWQNGIENFIYSNQMYKSQNNHSVWMVYPAMYHLYRLQLCPIQFQILNIFDLIPHGIDSLLTNKNISAVNFELYVGDTFEEGVLLKLHVLSCLHSDWMIRTEEDKFSILTSFFISEFWQNSDFFFPKFWDFFFRILKRFLRILR